MGASSFGKERPRTRDAGRVAARARRPVARGLEERRELRADVRQRLVGDLDEPVALLARVVVAALVEGRAADEGREVAEEAHVGEERGPRPPARVVRARGGSPRGGRRRGRARAALEDGVEDEGQGLQSEYPSCEIHYHDMDI